MNSSSRGVRTGVLIVVVAFAASGAPITLNTPINVMCGTVNCGQMTFTQYENFESPTFANFNIPSGGARIKGQFKGTRPLKYHYVQSVNRSTEDDIRWRPGGIDSPPIVQPWIDSPPGGYFGGFESDYLLYYDRAGQFPEFSDEARRDIGALKNFAQAGKKQEVDFEAWLVCVIEEQFGKEAKQAKDDRYTIAPLFGWTWGYTAAYVDNKDGKEDEKDIKTTKSKLETIASPSKKWTEALARMYGDDKKNDKYNVVVGNCKDCQMTPEPAALLQVAGGLVFLVLILDLARPGRRRIR
jgi:hypothetical protein